MDKALQLLGLIYRANKLVLGETVLEKIDSVKLLIIASDISDKSKERYLKKCVYYHIDYVDSYNYLQLSEALGKNNVKVIGITDEGFKESFMKKI